MWTEHVFNNEVKLLLEPLNSNSLFAYATAYDLGRYLNDLRRDESNNHPRIDLFGQLLITYCEYVSPFCVSTHLYDFMTREALSQLKSRMRKALDCGYQTMLYSHMWTKEEKVQKIHEQVWVDLVCPDPQVYPYAGKISFRDFISHTVDEFDPRYTPWNDNDRNTSKHILNRKLVLYYTIPIHATISLHLSTN